MQFQEAACQKHGVNLVLFKEPAHLRTTSAPRFISVVADCHVQGEGEMAISTTEHE